MKNLLIQSLKQQGFSKKIIQAFEKVPREKFIPTKIKSHAYIDTALPIGSGQTISQPYTIATMLELLDLKPKQKVLEIGSGSGYVLALISEITKNTVYGVELLKPLSDLSIKNLNQAGYDNIKVYNRNGNLGLKQHAPFDRIILSARTQKIPQTLIKQLKEKGIIVAPIGPSYEQTLTKYQKIKSKLVIKKQIPGFVFVPLV